MSRRGEAIRGRRATLTLLLFPAKQLEGVARLYWLGFDLSHIVLPIYSYRMQLFFFSPGGMSWYNHLPSPWPVKVLAEQLSLNSMKLSVLKEHL